MWKDILKLYGRAWNMNTADRGMWDTQSFLTANGNLCLIQSPPSAFIPLETSLFVGKLNLSNLQAADWFLVTVKRDRWVENKYYYPPVARAFYSTFWDKGTPCLVISNIFLCTPPNTNLHYSLRDSKGICVPVSHQKAQCNAENSVQHLHYSYTSCGVHSLIWLSHFPLFTESLLYNN